MRTGRYSGYRIIEDAPKIKMQAVVESECECPVCRKADTATYVTRQVPSRYKEAFQNVYECTLCGTRWEGNRYDSAFRPMPKGFLEGTKTGDAIKNILKAAVYLLICAFAGRGFSSRIVLIIFNFMAFSSVALAGFLECDKQGRKKLNLTADVMLIGLIVQIMTFN